MEFISDGLAEVLQPSSKMLEAYYEKNKKNYHKPALPDFKYIYLSTSNRKMLLLM